MTVVLVYKLMFTLWDALYVYSSSTTYGVVIMLCC